MDNSIQPINDPENFTIPESNPDNHETPYVPTQPVIVNDDRPTSAKSTTSTKIMETNTDELLDQTLQQNE